MTKNIPEPTNMLHEIYHQFLNSPILFRQEVCEECNYSVPTFYRKMRGIDKPSEHDKNKIIPALSNAEKEGILRKAKIVAQEISDFINKYK